MTQEVIHTSCRYIDPTSCHCKMNHRRPYPPNLNYYPLVVLRARFFLEMMNPMQKEQLEILTAMVKIPGLRDLVIAVENIPDAAEFEALNAEFQADMEATFAAEWELGVSAD